MGSGRCSVECVGKMNFGDELRESYRGSTALITGHTGFKGGWLALWLESLGAKVIGYSLEPPTNPSFFQKTGLSGRIEDIRGDVRDFAHIAKTVDKYRPDFVFHLAAQPLVRASYRNPRETFDINIMGTVNVLESLRLAGPPAICVCITSDKCYENREWDYAYRESDPMGGFDPYSASKGAAEIVIASYRKSLFARTGSKDGFALASARAGNIIGGGDWAEDRIVPDCVRALAQGREITIRNPESVRPWQFVLDPLAGYLRLASAMKENPDRFSDSWNFGPYPSNSIDVRTLTEKIIREWGNGSWKYIPSEGAVHEAGILRLDITKAIHRLGWEPVYGIDQAIRKTVEWYRNDLEGSADMYDFSLHQIVEYMHDADVMD